MGAVTDLPLDHSESISFLEVKGLPLRKNELIDSRSATPDYFQAMGIPLLSGRFFSGHDIGAAAPVSIVNSSFVKSYLKGRDALGTQLRLGMGDGSGTWTTIVGVVGDIRHTTLEEKPRPEAFGPLQPGFFEGRTNFAFRVAGAAGPLVTALHETLHRLDATLAFEDVHTMGERVAEAGAQRRFQTALLIAFAGAAVLLASVGLYGLMVSAVRQRTAELGLRMALGASRRHVLAMVLRHGLTLVAAGLLIGIAGALGLTRLMTSWLYGVQAADPVTFIAVPGLIVLIGLAACFIPAWQATRVDPITSLRHD
jgi:putative ABC transport system permease protein